MFLRLSVFLLFLFINISTTGTPTINFSSPGFSQSTASVNGYVSDISTGETLIAANVALLEINTGMMTNNSGYYAITNVPAGTYTLVVTYLGYSRYEQEVQLEAGKSHRFDIELVPNGLELETVTVTAENDKKEQKNIGVAQVRSQMIRDLPSVLEPDVFRSIQLLPGVKAASDFSSGLYIRGGSPDQTLILLDETTVYNPSHFFGFYSTFNPDAVKNVRLYKGGYPAEFGGRLGSVLTVYNKDGNRNEFQGSASLGMLASRVMLEGPIKEGSWMLALRRSTLEPVLAIMRTQLDGIPDSFYFMDINGKVNFDLSRSDRISVAFYSGQDRLRMSPFNDTEIALDYSNRTFSSNWRHIFSDKFFATATLTASHYFNKPGYDAGGTPFQRNNDVYDFSLKTDFEYYPNSNNTVSAGLWAGLWTLKLHDVLDGQVMLSDRKHSRYLSFYLQDRWNPDPALTVTAGIRGNTYSSGSFTRLEPRLSFEYRPHSNIRLQAAYGRYYQFLTLISNEAFAGFDLWLTTDEGVPPSFGDQFAIGAKTIPFENWGLDVELYYRTMNDLFELNPFYSDPTGLDYIGLDYPELFRFGDGYAWGVEVFLERQMGRLTGFVGYTYGITRRKFPGFNRDILDDPSRARFYPPKHDRTHDANLVLQYKLSDRWRISSVFSYATGQAYTEPSGRMQLIDIPWDTRIRDTFITEQLNSARLPSYHRLDFGISRLGRFFNIGDSELQFQIINAYSRRNIWFYQYDFDDNPVKRNDARLLPIIPSFSYTVNF